MKLIIGLGNPGEEYKLTKHNLGFLAVDYVSEKNDLKIQKKECDSLTTKFVLNGENIILAKPQTFMNLSGNAVSKLKQFYKVDNKDIIIIYDDIDIPFGEIRYREKGSGGSHNGMKNIVQMLSSENIARIRIGIGGIKYQEQPIADFVLSRFSKDQQEILKDIFDKTYIKLEEFLDK